MRCRRSSGRQPPTMRARVRGTRPCPGSPSRRRSPSLRRTSRWRPPRCDRRDRPDRSSRRRPSRSAQTCPSDRPATVRRRRAQGQPRARAACASARALPAPSTQRLRTGTRTPHQGRPGSRPACTTERTTCRSPPPSCGNGGRPRYQTSSPPCSELRIEPGQVHLHLHTSLVTAILTTVDARAVFLAANDALNRRDVGALHSYVTPQFVFHPRRAPITGDYIGYEGVEQFLRDNAETFDLFHAEYRDIRVLDDERLVAIGELRVRGIGSHVDQVVPIGGVGTFQDGRLASWYDYGDHAKALAAAGVEDAGA